MGEINAATGLYCILGSPVGHSLSPAMHNAAFTALGLNAVYLAFQPRTLAGAVDAMRTLPIRGASVTLPYKSGIMPLLDDIEASASEIGAVNTLVNADGLIRGHNTDGAGAVAALKGAGVSASGARALVLGNGGSARAVAFALLAEGASVVIAGRNLDRVLPLAEDLRGKDPAAGHALISDLTASFMKEIDIVINTTPIGMAPDTGSMPLPGGLIAARHTVFDIVYAPHETALIAHAAGKGCRVVHGIDMLLLQGALQFELWTGMPAPLSAMRAALEARLRS